MTRLLLAVLALASCRQAVNWLPDPPWSMVPISVQWSTIDPVFDRSIGDALKSWNHAAGCTVLEQAGDWSKARVSVSTYDGTICGSSGTNDLDTVPGATAGASRCSSDYAEIKFKVMGDIRRVHVVALHELGHVLGLGHDRSAVMSAEATADESTQSYLPWPSDADGAAVGARYCK